jgi:hypothetical protein
MKISKYLNIVICILMCICLYNLAEKTLVICVEKSNSMIPTFWRQLVHAKTLQEEECNTENPLATVACIKGYILILALGR